MGSEGLFDYLDKYHIPLEIQLERVLGSHKPVKLSSFINSTNSDLASNDAVDLLEKMLQYDHVGIW